MLTSLRVLILEDLQDDAELMLNELRKAAYEVEWQRVESEENYLAALEWQPEIILADYTLPQFDALRALKFLRERNLDIPFIVVTSSISEELAVQCIKQGAADYLLKDRLTRLSPAVSYALESHKNRRQRQQAEESLRYREMFYHAIFDSISDHVAIIDQQGKIILINEAWKRFAQENGDPTLLHTGVGVNYLDVCWRTQGDAQTIAQAVVKGIEAVLAGKLPRYTLPEYTCHSTTEKQWFLLKVTPLPPQIGGAVVAHPNITERKLAEAQLRQRDRLSVVGQLAAGIAHDFNNVLSSITLYSQILLKSIHDAENKEYLRTINRQAKRASRLVAQIMDFGSKSMMERYPLELRSSLNSFVGLLKRTLHENIQIKLNCPLSDLFIQADLIHLEQVFMNLAINARDAMPVGGSLKIDVETFTLLPEQATPMPDMSVGDWVSITFSDSGIGIPPENLPHIFEPFFTTKGPGNGTGLGLTRAYDIIKQLEGFIDVTSQVGQGTSFKLYFPVVKKPDTNVKIESSKLPVSSNGETILVIEDDLVTRSAACHTLRLLNYRIFAAKNSQEALLLLEQHKNIRLVLSDLVMPGIDGEMLYQRIIKKSPDVKIVIMTGYSLPDSLKVLHHSGRIGYLTKPFDIQQVAEVVFTSLHGNHIHD